MFKYIINNIIINYIISLHSGQYAEDGSHYCLDCPAGNFAAEEGSAMCEPCDPGTFSVQAGQEQCSTCPAGQYTAAEGLHCLVMDVNCYLYIRWIPCMPSI